MDNNEAKRRQRGPVVARKNFYGSESLWSGRLAAMFFPLFQTLHLWRRQMAESTPLALREGGRRTAIRTAPLLAVEHDAAGSRKLEHGESAPFTGFPWD